MHHALGTSQRDFAAFEAGLDAAWAAARAGKPPDEIATQYSRSAAAADRIERIAHAANADDKALALESCARTIETLDVRAREILNDQRVRDDVLARGLAVLRGEARLVRRITRAVQGLPPLDESAFRLIELQDAENTLRARFHAEPKGTLAAFDRLDLREPTSASSNGAVADGLLDDLRAGRLDLLRRQAASRIETAAALTSITIENAGIAFSLFRALDAAHRDIVNRKEDFGGAGAEVLARLVLRIESERARLEREFFAFVDGVDSPAGLEVLARAARALEHELDDARVVGMEPATEARVARLRHLQIVGERFLRSFRTVLAARNAPLPTELKRLASMLKRVRHVVGDRVLELRLNRIFGSRAVRTWDTFIFWLILSVLVLIAIDHYRAPDAPGEIHWTIWADTAICAFLLLDFTVRTLLSPNPLRYFQRHFLTELLPALPYGLLANLEHLTAVETIRTVRIVRTLRFLQALRPIIRIGRLFLFVSRAADRLVEQNAWLLNRNIMFFTDAVADEAVPTLVKRSRELEGFIARQSVVAATQLRPDAAWLSARTRLQVVAAEGAADSADATEREATMPPGFDRDPEPSDPDVDDVIHRLRDLDEPQVAEFVGVDFAQQLTDSLRFFRLPWLRRMPVVRFILGDSGVPDPLATTARLGRVCGDALDFLQRTVNWFADLYGTITPSQFLDRVGSQIVKATARPARRLILFGLIVAFFLALVELTRSETLDHAAGFLIKFLSLPVLVLGLLCAVPLAIGTWFRHIARQAADFYDRIAEAQFLRLTEMLKEETRDDDLRFLAARVVEPEALLAGCGADEVQKQVDDFLSRGLGLTGGSGGSPVASGCSAGVGLDPTRADNAILFYRDFLDGAYFHKTDVKVANLLLGNLTLENVRQNRLRFSKREWKRLERIDIARGKGGVAGAAVWFHCITHSVSQNVARLILEYNRHCIPLGELESASSSDRERFQRWLEERELQSKALSRGEAVLPVDSTDLVLDGMLTYRTTEFQALHFLSANPWRDDAVRRHFGARVLRFLREDRENLIRVIFGTYPMRDLPRERRTINPYELYRRHVASGMLYLLPLKAILAIFKGLRRLVREVIRLVREVRKPETRTSPRQSGHASFEVARRKIHRMRRPIVMEALRLRAEFDPEYLGLALPDRPASVPPRMQFAEDLRTLNATEREWEEYRRLKSRRQEQLRRLARVLRTGVRRGRDLLETVAAGVPTEGSSVNGAGDESLDHEHLGLSGEAARAVAIAFACDHDRAASRLAALERLTDLLHRVELAPPPPRRRWRLPRPGRSRVTALVLKVWPMLSRDEKDAADSELRTRVVETLLTTDASLRDELETLAERAEGGSDGIFEDVWRMLSAASRQPSSYTEQVIAVRAVHALAMLDLAGYERLVEGLGGYFTTEIAGTATAGS